MKEICIITGGGTGLGKELAREVLKQGYDVALIARNQTNLLKTQKELKEEFDLDVLVFAGTVANEEFVEKVYDDVSKKYQIKYLFNNAGVGRFVPAEQNTKKIVNEVLEGILIGTILMSTYALPHLKKNADLGIIINIISMAALKGYKMESAYSAAKWGQRGYSESLRSETFGTNIKVVNVYPGGINTPFWEENRNYVPVGLEQTFINPKELAALIVENITKPESLIIKDLILEQKHMNLE